MSAGAATLVKAEVMVGASGNEAACGTSLADRVRLAARTSCGDTLDMLAQDEAITVRVAAAMNPAMAHDAHGRLARDPDERVRVLLAGKLARLLPGLSATENAAAQEHVHGLLWLLAEDAAVRVRLALSEALLETEHAPRALMVRLAGDADHLVSDRVLRLSPLLTDADLLALLATPPHGRTIQSLAGRPGLSAAVADGIAVHADTAAVRILLANRTASIQEATLDALAGRAGAHPEWHEPLVRRPELSAGAMGQLSGLVAEHLLAELLARDDMPPELAEQVRSRLVATERRLDEAELLARAHAMASSGRLDEAALLARAQDGDHAAMQVMLAVAADVPPAHVARAVALRSGKALVSLVHRAGFGMRAGMAVQALLGRLGLEETVHATATGGFPLTPAEMEWQIELLQEPGR